MIRRPETPLELRDGRSGTTAWADAYIRAVVTPIMVVERDGLIVDMNPAACNLLHCRGEDMIGLSWIRQFAPLDRTDEFAMYFESLTAPDAVCSALPGIDELRTSGDRRLAIAGKTTVLRDTDDRVAYIVFALEPCSDPLNPASGNSEELARLCELGKLTTGIAHDFGNVLQVIRGNTELLSLANDEVDEPVDAVFAATDRGASLVNWMMAFVNKDTQPPHPVRVDEHINNVVSLIRRTFPKNVHIDTDIADGVSNIVAEGGRFESALLNVAINARDAMPYGGVLTITCQDVVVADDNFSVVPVSAQGRYVWISISDSGQGVSPQLMPRIFERFFTTKGNDEGTGLGLASVSDFARRLGGYVNAVSPPGKGLTLNILLPAADGGEVAVTA